VGSLSQAKTLGGVGSILALLGIIPYVGTVLVIIGWVLVIVAIKYISDSLQDRTIFNNALISILLAIVGSAIAGIVIVGAILGFMGFRTTTITTTTPGIIGLVSGIIVGLLALWILAIISAYFLRKSYDTVATRLNVNMFRTGALIYLIGAALTIILIGFLLILVAQILFIIAFFSIPDTLPTSGMQPPPSTPGVASMGTPTTQQPGAIGGTKFCVKCGASLSQDASFCPNCGASQPPTR
jgi:uncharacterized membrane protein